MTALLVSVKSVAEAELALAADIDLIDLKDPADGSLGAVSLKVAEAIVARLAGRRVLSATVGDLASADLRLAARVHAYADAGIDVIKVGCFDPDALVVLKSLHQERPSLRLAAVVFADQASFAWSPASLLATGVVAVVLDTCDKSAGRLTDLANVDELRQWTQGMQSVGLAVGLAGSLRISEALPLQSALQPELLGFRGALCQGGRSGALDPQALAQLRAAVPKLSQLTQTSFFHKEISNVLA